MDAVGGRTAPGGGLVRWRQTALADSIGKQAVLIALGAGLIEIATMVPYLAALVILVWSTHPKRA